MVVYNLLSVISVPVIVLVIEAMFRTAAVTKTFIIAEVLFHRDAHKRACFADLLEGSQGGGKMGLSKETVPKMSFYFSSHGTQKEKKPSLGDLNNRGNV